MNRSLSAFSYEKYIINYVYYIIDLIECKQFIEEVAKKDYLCRSSPNIYGGHRWLCER